MKHQLALQFPGASLADYNAIVALEAALIKVLDDTVEMDGHHIGKDTMNLFILTDDPAATLAQLKPVLERYEQWEWVTAATRPIEVESYTVIWPPDWRKEFRIV